MDAMMLRAGIYVDGSFFRVVGDHYRTHSPHGAPISLTGLLAWCRNEISRRAGNDLAMCRFVDAHYFWTRPHSSPRENVVVADVPLDEALGREGIVAHEIPKEGGPSTLDVTFAVEVLDAAQRLSLDVVVLVAGSPALVPLARKLAAAGAVVMIVAFDVSATDARGALRRIRTPASLLEEAVWPVSLSQIIERTASDDPLIRGLFASRPPRREEKSAEARQVAPRENGDNGAPPPGPLKGTIVDVRDRMGFLVEDWNRRRLFFHQSAVAAPTLGELRMGDRVQYERGLDPKNRACAMQVIRLSSAQPAPGNQLSPEAQPMTQEAPTTTEPMPETALSPEPPDDLPSTVPQS